MKVRFLSVFLTLILAANIFAASSKISPDLQGVDPNSNVRVIVQYNHAVSVSSASASSSTSVTSQSGGLLGGVLGAVGGVVSGAVGGVLGLVSGVLNSVLGLLNAIVCTVPASSLESLASNPNVTYISPDRTVAGQLDYSAAAVNANAAWRANLTGAGIGVAVIDSGIHTDPDLSILGILPRVVYTQDFTGGNGADQYGHGTHIAGIIGANGIESHCFNCTRSFVGIAPNASLLNLRVLDVNGMGSDSAVITASARPSCTCRSAASRTARAVPGPASSLLPTPTC
jgi:subtilisin family serine protease